MGNVTVKTDELTGLALDWAVAEAIGWFEPFYDIGSIQYIEEDKCLMMTMPDPDEMDAPTDHTQFNHYEQWSPRRIWSQCGKLIGNFNIDLSFERKGLVYAIPCNDDGMPRIEELDDFGSYGPDHPTAVCRSIVKWSIGETVNVPAELLDVLE